MRAGCVETMRINSEKRIENREERAGRRGGRTGKGKGFWEIGES